MAKYLRLNAGRTAEALTVQTSAGAGDADKIPSLDGAGRLDLSMMPAGIGVDSVVCPASEALAAGDYVNIWNDGGTIKARKADATTTGKEANGFVRSAFALNASATVFLEGANNALSGLTLAARYYLSTTPGLGTTTPPSAAGNIVQYLGNSLSATSLNFEPEDGIVLA